MRKLFVAVLSLVSMSLYAGEKNQQLSYNLQKGMEAAGEGKYSDALNYISKELSQNPSNGYAYMLATSIYTDNEVYGRAMKSAELAIKYIPKKDKSSLSFAYSMRGSVYLGLEDTVKALDDYATAIKINPRLKDAYKNRGDVYFWQKKYDLCDSDYKKLISIDKSDVTGYMGLGRSLNAQKKWDAAIEQFNYVEKMDPEYSSTFSFRADSYIGKKEWDKATDDLVTALKIDGDDKAFYMIQSLEDEPFDKIKAKFQIQASKEPKNYHWPYYNGIIHENKRKYKQAISYYEASNKIDLSVYNLERIANCYFKLGQFEKSLEQVDKALGMDPQILSLQELRANLKYELGDTRECLVLWDSIQSNNPDNAFGYYHRGRCKMYLNDIQGSIEDFGLSITIDPTRSYYYSSRAAVYQKLGKDNLAKEDYAKVIELEKTPDDYSCSHYAYLALGDSKKAIEVMDSIIARDTLSGSPYYDAACLYSRMNRPADALRYLEMAFQKGWNHFNHVNNDFDMDLLRDLPEFKALLEKYKKQAKADDNTTSEKLPGLSEEKYIEEKTFVEEFKRLFL